LLAIFSGEIWWTGRDLNPGPPRCQRGDHTRLIYPPKVWHLKAEAYEKSYKRFLEVRANYP
jgi:hypothetical protein